MKKFSTITLTIVVFSLLVFAAGCTDKNSKNAATSGATFLGGTTGLEIKFATGSLPDKVLDKDQSFGISVIMSNKGEKDIALGTDAILTITGIDPADFGVSASDLKQSPTTGIRSAKKDAQGTAIQGETVSLDFPASGLSLTHQKTIAGSVDYNVRADVCYLYGTVSNTKLCVLEDILGTKPVQKKLCNVNEIKTVDNSGAPVQVSSFTESVSSKNKVSFVFKIKHSGTGRVFEKSTKCDDNFQKRDVVFVTIDTGISDGLSCSGLQKGSASGSTYSGYAQLLNGEREIRCTQTINTPTDMEKLVRIDLNYDYKQYIEKKLTVQHVGS